MRFEWDENKNRGNLQKHGIGFETAALIFDDPFAVSQRDLSVEEEERWITIGRISPGAVLTVVHTIKGQQHDETIRIISARKAEARERKAYAETHKRAEAANRRHTRQTRRRD